MTTIHDTTPDVTHCDSGSLVPTAPPDPHRVSVVVDGVLAALSAARAQYPNPDELTARILAGDDEAIQLGLAWRAEAQLLEAAIDRFGNLQGSDRVEGFTVELLLGVFPVSEALQAATGEDDVETVEKRFGAEVAARFAPVIHAREVRRMARYLDRFDAELPVDVERRQIAADELAAAGAAYVTACTAQSIEPDAEVLTILEGVG